MSIAGTIGIPFAENAGFPVLDGLIQRVMISMVWVWLGLTALYVLRQECKARPKEAKAAGYADQVGIAQAK